MISKIEKTTLRELAKMYAEASADPINEEKKRLWKKLNGLKPERPMVMIDQICWGEFIDNPELRLVCNDPLLQNFERQLRQKLFQWKHFPVDSVMEPYFEVNYVIRNSGFGLEINDETIATDIHNDVVSHKYQNQLQTDEDLEKIKTPVITYDKEETERIFSIAKELFDGILDVQLNGSTPYLSIWDFIAQVMPVEDALFAFIDRPEFMHELARRIMDGYLATLDQLEEQGLLPRPQPLIHCTGAYCDELPAEGYNPEKPRCKDIWMFGLAQMFSTVSPEMFEEFEVKYTSPICQRFGLVYYGCCDPLDGKMEQVRKIPNVRKVSMSPWTNPERGAKEIGKDFVFSAKPNPANVAMEQFNGDIIRKELETIKSACDRYGCPLEFILKDISTVKHDPTRLRKWADIAMRTACEN